MKTLFLSLFALFVLTSCQNNKNQKEEQSTKTTEKTEKNIEGTKTIINKIADAYGFEHWPKVEKVEFSFVAKLGKEETIRHWIWYPKKEQVILVNENERISYKRNNIMEEFVKTDKAFVNDSFWLLFPFHLEWDVFNHEVIENQKSPIQQKESTKLIVKYPDKGGYTPGDRYDVYLDENHHIIEWAYYPSGQDKPALINTFEDLSNFDGIKINILHRNPETGFQLNFRDVSIN
ncbi:hypothetical protein [Flavobacterium sp. CS20]|uniref:hypothetical protein n=1 Tax=Flavobacterium sp. CS20 TaxID=2775246 RepID=UPI001B3A3665|nr:hypothetical protein [Flavobacterium sp. CS20]QTY27281.1 hypothetical protein IGB25_01470 [Flavobacterium sp. CS20]